MLCEGAQHEVNEMDVSEADDDEGKLLKVKKKL